MVRVPIFTGRVTDEAELVLAENEKLQRRLHLRTLAGKDVEIIIRRKREQRSLDQNAYWHAVPFPILARHFGDSIEGVKHDLLGECFGWKVSPITKRQVPIKPSTSELTIEEGSFFQDWMLPWAMTTHGVDIPPPQKADY